MCRLNIHKFIVFFLSVFLISCQSTSFYNRQQVEVNTNLYLDSSFKNYQQYNLETANEVFALDDEMKLLVSEKLLTIRDNKKRAQRLLKHIFSKDNIDLAYKSSANLTASQAFHSQTANCMSLTIMAFALANEAGLDVKFQDVKVPEYWVRNGEYNMLTGHVNLVLTEPRTPNKMIVYGKELLQIDFDPAIYKKSFPKRVIDKRTVLAMFYNNKGAEALVNKNYSLAYAYFKEATLTDPGFSPGWGNLGILYKLTNNLDLAIKSYDYAVFLDKDNLTALSNLAFLFRSQGEKDKAKKIEADIFAKRSLNPYYHALLADEAFYRGDNHLALKYYRKAIRMDSKVHEFYFGIAKVHFALNDNKSAERAMKRALAYNKGSAIESQYVAKLNFIKQSELQN